MRGDFVAPYIDSGVNLLANAKPPSAPTNDWYQYSIEWVDGANRYRGPGPLIHQSFGLFNKTIDIDGLPGAALPPPTPSPTPTAAPPAPRCGVAWFEESKLQMVGSLRGAEPTPSTAPGRARGCLERLDFDIPETGGAYGVRGVTFTGTAPDSDTNLAARQIQYTDQLPYYCTIEAADYIRQVLNGSVFTVGLGNAVAPADAACYNHDPLQDSDNSFLRKDNFLARVSLDPTKTINSGGGCGYNSQNNFQTISNITIPASCAHRQTGKTFKVGYTPASGSRAPGSFNPGTSGEYIALDDPFRLSLAFSKIAKQILFRLNG
jgi:hypothetical protein